MTAAVLQSPVLAPAASRPLRLLALDPGAMTGAALYEGGRLIWAAALAAEAPAPAPALPCPRCRGAACSHVAVKPLALAAQLLARVPALRAVDLAVIERPAWWRSSTPNAPALLDLAMTAGALAGAAAALGLTVVWYEPRAWKNIADKATHQAQTLAALAEEERAALPRAPRTGRFLPDPLDAAGLGLFLLARAGRWREDPADFAELVEPTPARGRKRRPRAGGPVQKGLAFDAPADARTRP